MIEFFRPIYNSADRFFAAFDHCSVRVAMKINCALAINYHQPDHVAGVRFVYQRHTPRQLITTPPTNVAGFINCRADTLGRVRRCLAARSSLERSLRVIKLPRRETTGIYVGHRLERKSLYRRYNQLRGNEHISSRGTKCLSSDNFRGDL